MAQVTRPADRIVAQGVGKRLRRHHTDRPGTLQETLIRGSRGRGAAKEKDFWALRDVSFTVKAGQALGVIGANGAGKSSLLRLIGGVGKPTEGRMTVNGRINSLLELGAGFHPDLTGRENIVVNGVIAGLSRAEVRRRLDAMVAFAEVEHAVDSPLRTYSAGMQMRLAFAIAAHTDHEILLVDEVLAVGDVAFQQKCLQTIRDFKRNGTALVLVSHEPELVEEICDQALWLHSGQIAGYGPAAEVTDAYTRRMLGTVPDEAEPSVDSEEAISEDEYAEGRAGRRDIEITGVRLLKESGRPLGTFSTGQPLMIEIGYRVQTPVQAPNFVITLRNGKDEIISNIYTEETDLPQRVLKGSGVVQARLARLDIVGGAYDCDIGIFHHSWEYAYDHHYHALTLIVTAEQEQEGIIRPPVRWSLHPSSTPTKGLLEKAR